MCQDARYKEFVGDGLYRRNIILSRKKVEKNVRKRERKWEGLTQCFAATSGYFTQLQTILVTTY